MTAGQTRRSGAFARCLLLGACALAATAAPLVAQHSAFVLEALSTDLVADPGPSLSPLDTDFVRNQLRFPRVLQARIEARFNVKRMFHERGIDYPAAEIYLRAFKRERALELWARPHGGSRFELLKVYDICAMSGDLGPKMRQGDRQVPEGYYEIDFFNPQSDYLLSLHVDYPNNVDRTRPGRGGNLGGDIYVHGGCESIGCLAVTDEGIRELYWISVEARAAGQRRIPIHIFPARLTDEGLAELQAAFADVPALTSFWSNLKPGFDYFERTRRVPLMERGGGRYRLAGGQGLRDTGPLAGTPVGPSAEIEEAERPAPLPIRRGRPRLRGSPVELVTTRDSSAARGARLRGVPLPDSVRTRSASGSGSGGAR